METLLTLTLSGSALALLLLELCLDILLEFLYAVSYVAEFLLFGLLDGCSPGGLLLLIL